MRGLIIALVLCACGAGVPPASEGRPEAGTTRVDLPRAFQPTLIATGDFNGDGNVDVAVAGESQRLVILLGDGHGGLKAAPESARAGLHPAAMVVADVNGDRKLDLIVANHDTDHLTVLSGDGTGRFTAREVKVPSKPHPHMVAAADVDGDRRVDLITDSAAENRLLLVLANGGTASIDVGRKPYFTLSAADIDGDGNIDLVVPNQGLGTVSILLGDGQGHFAHAPQSPIAAGPEPFSATIADVNGDHRPDIVVANYSGHITDLERDGLTWIRNDGKRRFTAFTNRVVTTRGSWRIAAGDFNGDGIADAAITNGAGDDVAIAFGSRNGLRAGISVPTMHGPHGLAFADLDGDGRADLLVCTEDVDELLVIRGR